MLMTHIWLCLEIEHIGVWAAQNNLTLNCGKTKEMVIRAGGKRGMLVNPPSCSMP